MPLPSATSYMTINQRVEHLVHGEPMPPPPPRQSESAGSMPFYMLNDRPTLNLPPPARRTTTEFLPHNLPKAPPSAAPLEKSSPAALRQSRKALPSRATTGARAIPIACCASTLSRTGCARASWPSSSAKATRALGATSTSGRAKPPASSRCRTRERLKAQGSRQLPAQT